MNGKHYDAAEIVAMYDRGMSRREIAEEIGCSYGTVYLRLNESGRTFVPKYKTERSEKKRTYPSYCCALAGMLWMLDASVSEIAEEIGCCDSTVRKLLAKVGVEDTGTKLRKTCAECGAMFVASQRAAKFCSNKCKKKSANRKKKRSLGNRANSSQRVRQLCRKFGAEYDKSISLSLLIARDSNTCHVCKGQCDDGDLEYGSTGPKAPTIDHIVPLSRGGSHTWDNIKLAHHRCNSLRGASNGS